MSQHKVYHNQKQWVQQDLSFKHDSRSSSSRKKPIKESRWFGADSELFSLFFSLSLFFIHSSFLIEIIKLFQCQQLDYLLFFSLLRQPTTTTWIKSKQWGQATAVSWPKFTHAATEYQLHFFFYFLLWAQKWPTAAVNQAQSIISHARTERKRESKQRQASKKATVRLFRRRQQQASSHAQPNWLARMTSIEAAAAAAHTLRWWWSNQQHMSLVFFLRFCFCLCCCCCLC